MPTISDRIAAYIQNHTPVDARVLATEPPYWNVSFATGRPNNAGFDSLTNLVHHVGPNYQDAAMYLEPAAIRRMGIEYIHATDSWVAALPRRAQVWLADPRLFELLVRDGHERLFRVRQAFLSLDVPPTPESFAALRQAVPPTATAYLVVPPVEPNALRVAATLSHARLVGELDPRLLHLIGSARWSIDPLADETPEVVVLPIDATPWIFEPSARSPIWWRDDVAVYAPDGATPRVMDAPAPVATPGDPPPVRLEVTDVTVSDGRIEFVATFEERASQEWTSQDWVVLEGDRSPWAIPARAIREDEEPTIAKWFAGLLSAGSATTSHTYRFDARASELAVRNDAGALVPLRTSAAGLAPGGATRWRCA